MRFTTANSRKRRVGKIRAPTPHPARRPTRPRRCHGRITSSSIFGRAGTRWVLIVLIDHPEFEPPPHEVSPIT